MYKISNAKSNYVNWIVKRVLYSGETEDAGAAVGGGVPSLLLKVSTKIVSFIFILTLSTIYILYILIKPEFLIVGSKWGFESFLNRTGSVYYNSSNNI